MLFTRAGVVVVVSRFTLFFASYGIPCGNCFLTTPSMTYVEKKILAQTKVFTNLLTTVIGVPVSPR